ncbi:hypothetical protein FRC06_005122 [Ceratobasidium sp. 370]|nr:hypothetical protein FRC06_005122 [Ceratobasidium sp. 370]
MKAVTKPDISDFLLQNLRLEDQLYTESKASVETENPRGVIDHECKVLDGDEPGHSEGADYDGAYGQHALSDDAPGLYDKEELWDNVSVCDIPIDPQLIRASFPETFHEAQAIPEPLPRAADGRGNIHQPINLDKDPTGNHKLGEPTVGGTATQPVVLVYGTPMQQPPSPTPSISRVEALLTQIADVQPNIQHPEDLVPKILATAIIKSGGKAQKIKNTNPNIEQTIHIASAMVTDMVNSIEVAADNASDNEAIYKQVMFTHAQRRYMLLDGIHHLDKQNAMDKNLKAYQLKMY